MKVSFVLVLLGILKLSLNGIHCEDVTVEETNKSLTGVDEVEEAIWRELGPNESMPVGSHVRFDLSEGKKYINEGGNSEKGQNSAIVPSDVSKSLSAQNDSNETSIEMIERVFQNLPEPDSEISALLQKEKEIKKLNPTLYQKLLRDAWERRQVEIQEATDAILDEAKLLKTLISSLDDGNLTQRVTTLRTIEDMVSDFDMATEFAAVGGLEKMVLLLTDPTNYTHLEEKKLKENVFLVIGTASKHHPTVQDEARNILLLNLMLEELRNRTPSTPLTRLIYALGGLIRENEKNRAIAQEHSFFLSLTRSIADIDISSVEGFKPTKKSIDLISDILDEIAYQNHGKIILEEQLGHEVKEICAVLHKIEENLNRCMAESSTSDNIAVMSSNLLDLKRKLACS